MSMGESESEPFGPMIRRAVGACGSCVAILNKGDVKRLRR